MKSTPTRRLARHLAGASLLCMGGIALAGPARAQEADISAPGTAAPTSQSAQVPSGATAPSVDDDSTVIVTGIRASLSKAADLKRNSAIILDAITSEDLGKFPDSNVAEALQRIPGVAISRDGGEGARITVRGFGPRFENVLVNGRTYATDSNGREFNFDTIAAELISGADVYKSSRALLQEGGLGATVNLHTPRPLEIGKFKAVINAKANYETNNGEATPQVFGLISSTFGDGHFGALFSVSYQRRNRLQGSVVVGSYPPGQTLNAYDPTAATTVPRPDPIPLISNVSPIREIDYGTRTDNRSRLGFNGTLQWAPTDTLTFTADGLYSKLDTNVVEQRFGAYLGNDNYTSATIGPNRTVSSFSLADSNLFATLLGNARVSNDVAAGFNAEWKPTSNFKLAYDFSYSKAFNDDKNGILYSTIAYGHSDFRVALDPGGGIPTFEVLNRPDVVNAPANAGYFYTGGPDINGQNERITETKLDGEWKRDGAFLNAIRFGGLYSQRQRNAAHYGQDFGNQCLYCGAAVPLPPGFFTARNLGSGFLGGRANGRLPSIIPVYDQATLFNTYSSVALTNARDLANVDGDGLPAPLPLGTTLAGFNARGGFTPILDGQVTALSEKVYAGYVEGDLKWRLFGMDWFVNGGLRFVHTELVSTGARQELVDVTRGINTGVQLQFVYNGEGVALPGAANTAYDLLLPSGNIRLNVTDKILARFSGSQTVTRAAPGDLAPTFNFNYSTDNFLDAGGSNPGLKPYKSTNFDLSFEWYPKKSTFFSVGLFYKSISDFIVQQRANETFTIRNSQRLDLNYAAAIAAGAVGRPVSVVNGNPAFGPTSVTFSVLRPRNFDNADVQGIEIAGTIGLDFLPSPFDGFGVTGNATFISTSAGYDPNSTALFTLEGLGNSYNVTVFYEKGPISARIAYNNRQRFLDTLFAGEGNQPSFTRDYGQTDFRFGYQVLKHLNLFAEGINVFDTPFEREARYSNQLLESQNDGARYLFGIRADF